jgi:hypothetical protein
MFTSRVPLPSIDFALDTYILYDASNRIEYVCLSYPGALVTEAKWQIFKLSYDGTSTRIVKKRWADATDTFDKIANNYAGYDYADI